MPYLFSHVPFTYGVCHVYAASVSLVLSLEGESDDCIFLIICCCPTLCDPRDCSTLGFLSLTISRRLLKLMSIELVMPSNHLILSRPLLPLSIFPSIRVFSSESAVHIRWPEYWSFSFSISPSSGYSGLISFRIDWFDLLTVQGTLQSLSLAPQFESINSLVLSHLYGLTLTSIDDYQEKP